MRSPLPEPPGAVPLTEMREGAPPPQPEEAQASVLPGPAPSRLARLRDFILSVLLP